MRIGKGCININKNGKKIELTMRIKDIKIENFRGFKNKSFEFDPKMNVILGDNTTGKTTLLQAIQIALGAFLQEMTFLPGGYGYSRNFKPNDHVKEFNWSSKSFIPIIDKPSIEVDTECVVGSYDKTTNSIKMSTQSIWWKRTGNKNSKANAIQLMDFVANMEDRRRYADTSGINAIFPLFLSFGANRLENNYRSVQKTKKRESREAKAYKCALDEQVDFKGAFDWLYRYDKKLKRGLEFEGTHDAFIGALIKALPAMQGIIVDMKNEEFWARIKMTKDEEPYWLTYDMMSDGFKSMINIVAEIAHRCIELNGFLGHNAVKKTPGIIMIDELDLYLHPHWQQHILADLQKAFPMMQFMVTTHSPFIVQSVKSHNVITLDGVKGDSDPDKRNIEDIAVTEMNMDTARFPRYEEMVQKAERYYQLVKSGKENTAEAKKVKEELDQIEEQFSDDPAYVALLRAERNSK